MREMSAEPQTDARLEKVETVTISFETFKKALKRNTSENEIGATAATSCVCTRRSRPRWRQGTTRANAAGTTTMSGTRSRSTSRRNSSSSKAPSGASAASVSGRQRRTPATRSRRRKSKMRGGIEKAVEIGREVFWDEVRHSLPERFDFGCVHGAGNDTVELNWED